ncbi:transcriptional adapter 2-alpha [Anaeramoeba ignava]|uniref:Transcriptional adapter 2-alpha n=1 Tax=Anaeramoeba ignava TaxID=1746090 RepID=A0A9Q0RC77_ANAIG|nr:transcriptional adapter 2-alpha [Anaeramoeba ignava]
MLKKKTKRIPEFYCDICGRDITESVRIRCAVCVDVDLCVDCFAKGKETNTHKKNHPYLVIHGQRLRIFSNKWDVLEELLLLDAIKLYGLGNWLDIASHVGTKTHRECEKHYTSIYLESDDFPYPDESSILDSKENEKNSIKNSNSKSSKSNSKSSKANGNNSKSLRKNQNQKQNQIAKKRKNQPNRGKRKSAW